MTNSEIYTSAQPSATGSPLPDGYGGLSRDEAETQALTEIADRRNTEQI